MDWRELDREYFELWDWILKEHDGDWTKVYQGQCPQEAEEHRIKLTRFAEICRLIDDREQSYYFCWMTTINAGWSRPIPYQPPPLTGSQYHDLLMSNEPLCEIKDILHEILLTTREQRYYWLVSLLSALPESTNDEEAKRELGHACTAYRLRHHRYSEVFDILLGISDGFVESLKKLRDCLRTQIQSLEDAPVDVSCEFAAIRVDGVNRKRTDTINSAARPEAPKELTTVLDDKKMPCKHHAFFFCETDFIYPHCRRVHIAPPFRKFKDVAAVDYFYKYHVERGSSVLTRWPDETTYVIDRWSKEHVDTFKGFFIDCAEEENEKWRARFDAGIDSEAPDAAEKYLKNVYKIGVLSKRSKRSSRPSKTTSTVKVVENNEGQGKGKYETLVEGMIEMRAEEVARGEKKKPYTADEIVSILKETDPFKDIADDTVKKGVTRTQAWKNRKDILANARKEEGLGEAYDERRRSGKRHNKSNTDPWRNVNSDGDRDFD